MVFNKIFYVCFMIFGISISVFANSTESSSCSSCGDCSAICNHCGTIPYPTSDGYVTPDPIVDSPLVWSFISEPDLHPLKVTVNVLKPGTSSGYVLIAPYGFSSEPTYGQPGSLMLDNSGNPIWFRPLQTNLMNTDFRCQTYKGEKVLTFWQGTLVTPPAYSNFPGGSSEPGSCYFILDKTYRVIKKVIAQRGYISDIHEFLLTASGTALFLSTKAVPMDLTPFGGPSEGYIQDFAIQEIDLDTNQLLFFWSALDHIPLSESYVAASSAEQSGDVWDVFHLNSISSTDDANDILVSSRNCWTIYKINKPSGKIVWKLGGKDSSFTIGNGAEFSWQHDARFLSKHFVSLFNDNSNGTSTQGTSHGLILELNFDTMTARSERSYFHDPNLVVASQGNLQNLKNGNKFIGWGQSQYYSEFKKKGNTESDPAVNLVYDAAMPPNDYTYRAYRGDWEGKPHYPPSIGVASRNEELFVYASWNGSTETKKWKIYAGADSRNLSEIAIVDKSGFETSVPVNNNGPYFQVKALDKRGKVIGASKVIEFEP